MNNMQIADSEILALLLTAYYIMSLLLHTLVFQDCLHYLNLACD